MPASSKKARRIETPPGAADDRRPRYGRGRRAMIRHVQRIDRVFDGCVGALCVLLLAVMVIAISAQVVMRYAFSSPLTWSEELARYAMIWLAMLAAALCARHGQHIALVRFKPGASRLATGLAILGPAMTCAIAGFLFWHGLDITERAARQRTPGLGLSMSWAYASLPAGFALIFAGQILGALAQLGPARPR